MAVCDECSGPTTWETGTAYTADEYRRLVRNGHVPESLKRLSSIMGGASLRDWREGIVAQSKTPWLLCPACAAAAGRILPKAAGTGPGGGPLTESITDVLPPRMRETLTTAGGATGGAPRPGDAAGGCSFLILTAAFLVAVWWRPFGHLNVGARLLLSLGALASGALLGSAVAAVVRKFVRTDAR